MQGTAHVVGRDRVWALAPSGADSPEALRAAHLGRLRRFGEGRFEIVLQNRLAANELMLRRAERGMGKKWTLPE